MSACPCGSGDSLDLCCGPYLVGEALPETAEQLMRSRYAAFCIAKLDYVLETHDPATTSAVDEQGLDTWMRDSEWLGLEIHETEKGGPTDEFGRVSFTARFRRGHERHSHREDSVFRKVDGRWYYVDGKLGGEPIRREQPKVGRNEPCPCGSGKKFKRCCGKLG